VKPYVKRGKSDALDAAGICEAMTRPTMRYVAIKSSEQQAVLMLHRTRELLVWQRTMLVNALRGHLAEYGIIAPQGLPSVPKLGEVDEKARGAAVPELAWRCIRLIVAQLEEAQVRVAEAEQEILVWHRRNELSQRLETIPGIITASALAATITNLNSFRSSRHLAAWIGLVPRQSGTGGKVRLGHISKQGDRYLRRLLVLGATTLLRQPAAKLQWLRDGSTRSWPIAQPASSRLPSPTNWPRSPGLFCRGPRAIGLQPQRPHKLLLEPDERFARLVEVVMV